MNYEEVAERLRELKVEDFIWIIYIGIIFLSWFSNHLERKYFKTNNTEFRDKYRSIIILIFSVLVVVYIYFLKEAYKDLKNLKPTDTSQRKLLVFLSFLGSLFIVLSGIIFLFIALKDEDLEVELAFN